MPGALLDLEETGSMIEKVSDFKKLTVWERRILVNKPESNHVTSMIPYRGTRCEGARAVREKWEC